MADTTTTLLGLTKPEVGASFNSWGEKLNTNFDLLDGLVAEIEPQQLDGAGTGLLAAVSANAFAARSIGVGTGLAVANGSGVAGDPTVSFTPTALPAKALPVDADEVLINDSNAAMAPKKATRLNLLKAATLTAPRRVSENKGIAGSHTLDLATADYFILEPLAATSTAVQFANAPAGKVMEVTLVIRNGSGLLTFTGQTWLWPPVDLGGDIKPNFSAVGTDVVKAIWTGADNTVIAYKVAMGVA